MPPHLDDATLRERAAALTDRLSSGRAIDWDELTPLFTIPHDSGYPAPDFDHGTHVAGILGADWHKKDWGDAYPADTHDDLVGVCPGLTLFDLRVLNDRGTGDEFTVMAALQFIRHLNSHRDQSAIHGANLSLSLKHDVANYACGRTPVCDECERVVSSGVVVIAAAGNDGYMRFTTPGGETDGYRSISISDPGNAEAVITVGATHRHAPHTYGVSYFSSRGPTGDGRYKPDLVAPGEKITAPITEDRAGTKDGTSMAAPHVSGAAVLLMARNRELLGNPARVKEILCSTATDLGRERYFQGAGMIDILRALQSV
jgi:subtilisin family serine protease